jgi:hypothetical protein
VSDDLVLDLDLSPRDARERLAAAINRRPRRVLGLLKIESEFVGVVASDDFEIWERRQHAVHAHGRIDPTPVGSRIGATFSVTGRARILLVAFFALYLLAGLGILAQVPDATAPIPSWVALIVGALLLGALFAVGAQRQRDDVKRFMTTLFAETRER